MTMATIYNERQQLNYTMPLCPQCGKYMRIGSIDNIEPSKKKQFAGFDHAKIDITFNCEFSQCPDGIIKKLSYKMINPETHDIRKKKELDPIQANI